MRNLKLIVGSLAVDGLAEDRTTAGRSDGFVSSDSDDSSALSADTTLGEVPMLDPRELVRTAQLDRVEAVSSPADDALCCRNLSDVLGGCVALEPES